MTSALIVITAVIGVRSGFRECIWVSIHHLFHQVHSGTISHERRCMSINLPVLIDGKVKIRGLSVHLHAVGSDDLDVVPVMREFAHTGGLGPAMFSMRLDIGGK